MIQKIRKGQYADGLADPYEEDNWVEFENPDTIHPLNDYKPK